jgi:type VI secretion system protein ImpK
MDRIHEVTGPCLDALIQLRQAAPQGLPPPENVRTRLVELFDDLLERAARRGFVQADCQDIAYAGVALADEIAMGKSEAFRQGWLRQLLQLHYFGENTAGDGFFKRLEALRSDPQRAEVLKAYHLCLLLGFQGRYRMRGAELELLRLSEELGRRVAPPEALSPHVARPPAAPQTRRGPILMAAAAVLSCALLFYAGLRLALSSNAASVASAFTAASKR